MNKNYVIGIDIVSEEEAAISVFEMKGPNLECVKVAFDKDAIELYEKLSGEKFEEIKEHQMLPILAFPGLMENVRSGIITERVKIKDILRRK